MIDAGLRDALGRNAVSALSDYAQHQVSYHLINIKGAWFLIIIKRLEQLNFNANGSPLNLSKKINQRIEELKRRESKLSRQLNELRNMFEE